MTRRRWIADESSAHRAALTGAHADHLIRVLRAEVGQEFDIATAGAVRRARITAIHDHRVEFDLGDEVGAARPLEISPSSSSIVWSGPSRRAQNSACPASCR